jgi:hypothetical protein
MRMSLRDLLLLVAVVAVAIVSLKFASSLLSGIVGLIVLAAYMGSIIAAVIARGRTQAFAIGMALAITMYAALIMIGGWPGRGNWNYELGLDLGQLPTSTVLHWFFELIGERKQSTLPDGTTNWFEIPDGRTFMRSGHYWWALLFGYAGGRFAKFLYLQRTGETEK